MFAPFRASQHNALNEAKKPKNELILIKKMDVGIEVLMNRYRVSELSLKELHVKLCDPVFRLRLLLPSWALADWRPVSLVSQVPGGSVRCAFVASLIYHL